MKTKYLILMNLLTLASFNVIAEENDPARSGWFVGGFVGQGSVEIKSITNTNDQDNVTMFGTYGGYIFKDWFALEGSLYYFTDELADNQANLVSADLLVFSVTPKFIYSVNDAFSLYAKTGVSFMYYEEEYNNFIINQRGFDQSWSGTGVTIGLGAEYSFTTGISISANYDWTTAELDSDDYRYYSYAPDVDIDINQISIGAHYRFK